MSIGNGKSIDARHHNETPCVTDKFAFRTAVKDDAQVLLDLSLTGFLSENSHAKALKMTGNEAHEIHRWIVEASLNAPYSVMVHEKSSGKLVGFRLYSIAHRDKSQNFEPFNLDIASMTESVQLIETLMENQKRKIWSLYPNAEKVLRQELTFVDPHYQRQGIASHFIKLLNFDQLKNDGFAGIQSEASSHMNQKLLKKLGYKMLSESEQ